MTCTICRSPTVDPKTDRYLPHVTVNMTHTTVDSHGEPEFTGGREIVYCQKCWDTKGKRQHIDEVENMREAEMQEWCRWTIC